MNTVEWKVSPFKSSTTMFCDFTDSSVYDVLMMTFQLCILKLEIGRFSAKRNRRKKYIFCFHWKTFLKTFLIAYTALFDLLLILMASKLIQNCIPVSFFPKKTNVNSNKTSIDVEHRRITGNQFYLFLCYLAPLNVFVFTLRTYKELVLIPVSKYLTKQNIDNRHSCLVLFSFFSLFHCFVFFILVVRLCFRFDFIVFFTLSERDTQVK